MKRNEISRTKPARIAGRCTFDSPPLPSEDEDDSSAPARLRTIGDLDQRTRAARLAKGLLTELQSDLGGSLTAAERELAQRASLLAAMLSDLEAAWLERRPADLAIYGQLVDRQRRILEVLGLKRRARDVTTPLDYAREHGEAA